MTAPDECEPTDGERDREQVEPEVEERIPREREAEEEVGQRGAVTAAPRQEQRDETIEQDLAPHDALGGLAQGAAIECVDRPQGQWWVLDGKVRVGSSVPGCDRAVPTDVARQHRVAARGGVSVEGDTHGDDPHQEEQRAAPGDGPPARRHAGIALPERP